MTSAMDSPRRCLAEISPITQRTASMMFDLPHPFGPTTPVRLEGKVTVVGLDERVAHEAGLVDGVGAGGADIDAIRRPADFADHDALVGEFLMHRVKRFIASCTAMFSGTPSQ